MNSLIEQLLANYGEFSPTNFEFPDPGPYLETDLYITNRHNGVLGVSGTVDEPMQIIPVDFYPSRNFTPSNPGFFELIPNGEYLAEIRIEGDCGSKTTFSLGLEDHMRRGELAIRDLKLVNNGVARTTIRLKDGDRRSEWIGRIDFQTGFDELFDVNFKITFTFINVFPPVAFMHYDGNADTYITYQLADSEQTLNGDNNLMNFVDYYDIDIFSKTNYLSLIDDVIGRMTTGGFVWQPSRSSGDLFEPDTGFYHRTLSFAIERSCL